MHIESVSGVPVKSLGFNGRHTGTSQFARTMVLSDNGFARSPKPEFAMDIFGFMCCFAVRAGQSIANAFIGSIVKRG